MRSPRISAWRSSVKTPANLRRPIELVASLGDDAKSADLRALVEEIAVLSDKISARYDGTDARRPSFAIRADADDSGKPRAEVVFAGLPLGHEFTSLILALLNRGTATANRSILDTPAQQSAPVAPPPPMVPKGPSAPTN